MPLSAYLCLMHLTALFSLIKFSPTCKFMCLMHIVALRCAHTDCRFTARASEENQNTSALITRTAENTVGF